MIEQYKEKEEKKNKIELGNVPDWHYEPITPISEIGEEISGFSISHTPDLVSIPDEVSKLKKHLESKRTESFFNGPFVNVEDIRKEEEEIILETKETSLFDYIASDFFFSKDQDKNPVRPLAVQATLFSPGRKKIIIERRSQDLTDMPGKLTEFGGALKPGELDIQKAMQDRLEKKWNLKIPRECIIPTGLARDNVNNVYCACFSIEIPEELYVEARKSGRTAMREKKKIFYEVSAEKETQSIEKIFLGKRDIAQWEPLGYMNILFALVKNGLRTKEEVLELLEKGKELAKERPLEYSYPIEKFLPQINIYGK